MAMEDPRRPGGAWRQWSPGGRLISVARRGGTPRFRWRRPAVPDRAARDGGSRGCAGTAVAMGSAMHASARQDSSDASTSTAPASSPGKRTLSAALGPRVAAQVGRRAGHDLSNVTFHEDGAADELGTRAFARGDAVHVARGAVRDHDPASTGLLAHELAHVVQQREGRVTAQGQRHGVAINTDPALEAEADHTGREVAQGFDLDAVLDLGWGTRGAVARPVAQGSDLASTGDAATTGDATAAVRTAAGYLDRYGRLYREEPAPPAYASSLKLLFLACASSQTPVARRTEQFEQATAALAPAVAQADPDVAAEYRLGVDVVRTHLAAEQQGQGETGGDPLAELMGVRAAIGRAAAVGEEAKKLLTMTNTKRLAGLGKAVDWSALGELVTPELIPADAPPEYRQAATLLGTAAFENGFTVLDLGLTAWLAKDKLHDPEGAEGFSRLLKATFDLTNVVCRGITIVVGNVATLVQAAAEPAEAKVWATMAADCLKAGKLLGSSLGTITAGLDLITNVIVLWNGAEGLAAADALAGIAGAAASVLASGSKFLLDAGILDAGTFGGAVAADLAALATPLSIAIPVAWIATKVLLLEMGKLRLNITGALMAATFEELITDGGALARETEALGLELVAAAGTGAGPEASRRAIDDRVDLVRRFAEQLRSHGTDGRDITVSREVRALYEETAVLSIVDPVKLAAAARAVIVGVTAILDRAPELVAEEAGDPSFADRARNGAPAPTAAASAGEAAPTDDAASPTP